MKSLILAALLGLVAVPSFAASYATYPTQVEDYPGSGRFPLCKGKRSAMPDCVVDGDTVRIDYKSYRLGDLDTPETTFRAKCADEKALGMKAKARLIALLNSAIQVRVTTYIDPLTHEAYRDKYGRVLASIEADGANVGEKLIAEGLAHHYDGKTKAGWCAPPPA